MVDGNFLKHKSWIKSMKQQNWILSMLIVIIHLYKYMRVKQRVVKNDNRKYKTNCDDDWW